MMIENTLLLCILIGVFIGVVSEFGANVLGFWRYRAPWLAHNNVLVMFGVVDGGLAYYSASLWQAFIMAASIGTVYEIVNYKLTHWWEFPNNKMGPVRGIVPICVVLAFAWGSIPILINAGLSLF